MNRKASGAKAPRRGVISGSDLDLRVNALFSALTKDLDRPFEPGSRNIRSVVAQWCPLAQGCQEGELDVPEFVRSYLPAHFFDRYHYTIEKRLHVVLEVSAWETFQENLRRGRAYNAVGSVLNHLSKTNDVLENAALLIADVLGELDHEEWFSECGHGPNASVGVKRSESYLDRKLMTLTGTLPAIDLWCDYLEWNTSLGSLYLGYDSEMWPSGTSANRALWKGCCRGVAGNQLSFVPKKFDKLRTMMKEPVINQFFQLGLGNVITKRLRKWANIDLSTQPDAHRDLVKIITKWDLPIATLDWSQASDRLWCSLIERLVPADWYWAFDTVRSPYFIYEDSDGRVIGQGELPMIGTMGNGFTFPLQTLVFWALLVSICQINGTEEFVSVFGDDCIIDSSNIDGVNELALHLWWKLNLDKSYWTGGFRESCGEDCYRGTRVRPFMVERPKTLRNRTRLQAWAYHCYNGVRLALQQDAPYHTTVWLISFLKKIGAKELHIVPSRYGDSAGIQCFHDEPLETYLWFLLMEIGDLRVHVPQSLRPHGYTFSFLCETRLRVPAIWEPGYFVTRLEGKNVPQAFSHIRKKPAEKPAENLLPDKAFKVPTKRGHGHLSTKQGSVLTWNFWLP